jgi:hypothetical protein
MSARPPAAESAVPGRRVRAEPTNLNFSKIFKVRNSNFIVLLFRLVILKLLVFGFNLIFIVPPLRTPISKKQPYEPQIKK